MRDRRRALCDPPRGGLARATSSDLAKSGDVFYTSDVPSAYQRLDAHGVPAMPPFDHGFATLRAFRDPDGNNVQAVTPAQ
jgi:hypothetical protein